MTSLTDILRNATQAIDRPYFQLDIDGGDSVYRERVYCYELYHQMRRLWPGDCEFYLNGELDKAAHPILRTLDADFAKPDLLIHRPGYMSGNHAIIEIKHSISAEGTRKDLEKLDIFRRRVGYERAIYLIYGAQAESGVARIEEMASRFAALVPIELWLHREVGEPASHVLTLGSGT